MFEARNSKRPGKFCSHKCYHESLRNIPVGIFWTIASEDEKLDRIKKYFLKNVIQKEGCWDWNGCNRRGYVFINYMNKGLAAHRASWIIFRGMIPDRVLVLHKCDNRRCTNPEHLYLGTAKENAEDRKLRGRNRDQTGENNSKSKLTTGKVKEIRNLIRSGTKYAVIKSLYNISSSTISCIKYNKLWKDIK
jgi:hypothetical protein